MSPDTDSGIKPKLLLNNMYILAVFTAILIRLLLINAHRVTSGSMQDTLKPGDLILSERISYWIRTPSPGEIVVFRHSIPGSNNSSDMVKRVAATAGDLVQVAPGNPSNLIWINQQLWQSQSLSLSLSQSLQLELPPDGNQSLTIPEDHLYCLGDNLADSRDSRYWGTVPRSAVKSRVVFRYWPLNRIGKVN